MGLKVFYAISVLFLLVGCFSQPKGAMDDVPGSAYTKINFADVSPTPDERAICEAAGGNVIRAGLRGAEYCEQTYPDAGQPCQDGAECLGECRLSEGEEKLHWSAKPVRGVCQAVDLPFGCHQKVRNGKAEPGLCVD